MHNAGADTSAFRWFRELAIVCSPHFAKPVNAITVAIARDTPRVRWLSRANKMGRCAEAVKGPVGERPRGVESWWWCLQPGGATRACRQL
jgi:hypothetical protein